MRSGRAISTGVKKRIRHRSARLATRARGLGVVVCAALLVIGGAACERDSDSKSSTTTATAREVEVPLVVGLRDQFASRLIREAGLRVREQRRPSEQAAEDIVIAQDPPEGTTVTDDSAVTIVISSGRP